MCGRLMSLLSIPGEALRFQLIYLFRSSPPDLLVSRLGNNFGSVALFPLKGDEIDLSFHAIYVNNAKSVREPPVFTLDDPPWRREGINALIFPFINFFAALPISYRHLSLFTPPQLLKHSPSDERRKLTTPSLPSTVACKECLFFSSTLRVLRNLFIL